MRWLQMFLLIFSFIVVKPLNSIPKSIFYYVPFMPMPFNNNPPPINIQYELNSKWTNIIFCIRETNLFYITYKIILDRDLLLTDHNLILMLIKDTQKASDPNNSYQTEFKSFIVWILIHTVSPSVKNSSTKETNSSVTAPPQVLKAQSQKKF